MVTRGFLRRHRREGDGGYNLVALMVAVTVMNSLVAIALPAWSHIIRRDQEAELIFRGLQYAEAIRVFQQRFQRPPLKLKELIEVEPRSIRQLWENPLAENGRWTPIYANQRQRPGNRPGQQGRPSGDERPGGDATQPGTRPRPGGRAGGGGAFSQNVPEDGETVQARGPIVGVYSAEGGEAIKTWMGRREVSEWKFEVELLRGGRAAAYEAGHIGAHKVAGQALPVNAGDLGRPFPPGVVPPNQPGAAGQGGVAGGQGPAKGPPGRPGGAGGAERPQRGGGGR